MLQTPVSTGVSLFALLASGLFAFPAAAQIATDGTMGAAVNLTGPNFAVTPDLGTQRGGNLFHSFSTFSIPAGGSATFSGPTSVTRVISRVTGGEASVIGGKLASSVKGADLYLINSAGVAFTAGASLDVSGALHVSSAAEMRFPDGGVFSAAQPSRATLSVAAPESFGFAANPAAGGFAADPSGPAAVTVTGATLTGAAGKTLSLSGGDVTVKGGAVSADLGRINLTAAAAGATVSLADGAVTAKGGKVAITDNARVSTRGNGGGTVAIRGGALEVSGGARVRADTTGAKNNVGGVTVDATEVTVSDRGQISANTESGGKGGVVDITAGTLKVLGDGATVQTLVMARSTATATGDAGKVKIKADRTELRFGGNITASSLGRGNAGSVEISGGDILLSHDDAGIGTGTGVFSLASATNGGDAGSVAVNARSLELYGGAQISTRSGSSGQAGVITVNVDTLILSGQLRGDSSQIAGQNTAGTTGDAGSIVITAKSVTVADGAHITSKTRGGGRGGSISITADSILLSTGYPDVDSGVSSGATATATGDGGAITVNAGTLTINSGAAITTSTAGPGNAGTVNISVGKLSISGKDARPGAVTGVLSSATGATAGAGGAVTIRATTAEIADGGTVAAAAEGRGAAGNIAVSVGDALHLRGGSIATSTRNSDGGNIAITAGTLFYAERGKVTTGVAGGAGDGGNIVIARPQVAAFNDSTLSANAVGGNGGAITVVADNLTASTGARFDASSSLGVSGAVSIQALDSRPLNAAAPLINEFVDPVRLLRAACADRDARGGGGSLTAHRRVGVGAALAGDYRAFRAAARQAAAQGRWDAAATAYEQAAAATDGGRDDKASADSESLLLDYAGALLRAADQAPGGPSSPAGQARLSQARAVMERLKAVELENYFNDDCIAAQEVLKRPIDRVSPGVAAIYPILLPDRIELLVGIGDRLERVRAPVGRAELTRTAEEFRRLLEKRSTHQYREPARKLHDWLIAPLTPLLRAARTDTLVIVPDGVLRTIPLAALHDGERFLMERYAVAVSPGLTLIDPKPLAATGSATLLAGISEATQGFAALPHAARELDGLGALLPAAELRDGAFSQAALLRELRRTAYDIVHIASHGEFRGDHQGSFLLTHDGKLSLERLESMLALNRFRNKPVELLVLSACQTAAGDGRAGLGLAGVALKSGVRSAVATLWRVDDEASAELMQAFYRRLHQGGAQKAQALRAAQSEIGAQSRYRHPYYWSGYLMIGNWL